MCECSWEYKYFANLTENLYLYATNLPADRAPVASDQSFHCHPNIFIFFSKINCLKMKLIRKVLIPKAMDRFKQQLYICPVKVNWFQLETPKGTGKIMGRELWEWKRGSGLSCLEDLLNAVVHSQAIEMNMYSTTLISTNYPLNYGLWLYQALLNCEIHKLVKKLVGDPLCLAIRCSSWERQHFLLFSTKEWGRKEKPPGGSGWV